MALIIYKPPIFAATLKGFPIHKINSYLCMDFILENIRTKLEDFVNVEWLVIRGQHTVEACCKILAQRQKLILGRLLDLDTHEFVCVWSKNLCTNWCL